MSTMKGGDLYRHNLALKQFTKASMSFEPKHKVELDPPKDDIISVEYLSKCDATNVRRKGTVFDVTGNKAYGPEGSYKGSWPALEISSLKPEECRPEWEDLSDEHKKVLNDWYTYFSKRYNIKGKVEGATNM
ncbi:hypothetical protein D0867_00077 [Hortaea werneckii]|uniref:Cytochrome b5 heme-binding domain-containing protein n=1 Tax=Hortaea werneckii TaxID=91943 RepID=A0A3M7AFM8_HORWE|nr:hypothetical protein D0867_00077 [Hortaea werneckii]